MSNSIKIEDRRVGWLEECLCEAMRSFHLEWWGPASKKKKVLLAGRESWEDCVILEGKIGNGWEKFNAC